MSGHNSPVDRAVELFKCCTDGKSLLFSIKKFACFGFEHFWITPEPGEAKGFSIASSEPIRKTSSRNLLIFSFEIR